MKPRVRITVENDACVSDRTLRNCTEQALRSFFRDLHGMIGVCTGFRCTSRGEGFSATVELVRH